MNKSSYSICLNKVLVGMFFCLMLICLTGCKKEKELVDYTGQTGTINDIDGNTYNTIGIGSQIWMAENLNTTKFNDGTPIQNGWDRYNRIGAYCNYNNTPSNSTTYGRLYNWYAVDDNAATKVASNGGKNVCPTGWHVPTDAEWTTLENYLISNGFNYDNTTTDNKIAKALASTSGWTSSSITGAIGNTDYPSKRNSTGFSAVSGGSRGYEYYGFSYWYPFSSLGDSGIWWSTSETNDQDAWSCSLYYRNWNMRRESHFNKIAGFSVRCLRD